MEEVVQEGTGGAGVIVLAATTDESKLLYFPPPMMDRTEVCLNQPNIGLVKTYHELWKAYSEEDVLVYLHDDTEIHDLEWQLRVEEQFSIGPQVAVVGFGGATGIGDRDIYKKPYRIEQLARQDYRSNQSDWEVHGTRETGSRRVAVIDGFAVAVRGSFLARIGGWAWMKTDFHCYDIALCLMAARLGLKVKMVGVHATHHGGGTSTKAEYKEWCEERGTTLEEEHRAPHRWLYEEFRDVLPLRVG